MPAARKRTGRKTAAKKTARRDARAPDQDTFYKAANRIEVSDVSIRVGEGSFNVCSLKAWRDGHGLIVQMGGNTPLRAADWFRPKGAEQIKQFIDDNVSTDVSADVDTHYMEQALGEVIKSTPAGAERDAAFLKVLKEHTTFDEPTDVAAIHAAFAEKIAATIAWAGQIL